MNLELRQNLLFVLAWSKQILSTKVSEKIQDQEWYFVKKIILTYCDKKCSRDQEKLLKFEAEGQEFAKFLRSLEQFIQTVKVQNNFC